MLKENFKFEKRKAILLTVSFKGTIEEYAMAWLKLTNNAREYPKNIWKIYNDKGCNVYVICNPKSVQMIKDFCTGIYVSYDEKTNKAHYVGEVINEEEIIVGVPIYETESLSNTDEEFEKDMDNIINFWIEVEEE